MIPAQHDRVKPLGAIDMNNRGMRHARTVQYGFKELPIAMG